ncbi:MAG: zinc-binding dehydrogenase [Micrococcaceae bacterium]
MLICKSRVSKEYIKRKIRYKYEYWGIEYEYFVQVLERASEDDLDDIAKLLAGKEIILPIAETYPLEKIADAVAKQREGHTRGKIVVRV